MAALETVRGVPIARVGVWDTSTGQWVCTAAQLEDAVRASKDPAFRKAVLKLGHTDPRFNGPDGYDMDGSPAIGRLDNLRLDASGDVLLADLVGVPGPLAQILTSAYPSRSVEASIGVATATGNTYALVITGLALLGDTPPAIESLGDVLALYDQPTTVADWVAARRVAASTTTTGAPMPESPTRPRELPRQPGPTAGQAAGTVLASATIEELVTAAASYAMANGVEYAWVREVYTDRVIVSSDSPPLGRLWELDWTETGGEITFTGPYPVKIEYTRLAKTAVAAAAHLSIVPVRYVRGRGDVSASTPEEHPPVSDLAALVRERLGLPPDATDEAVTAALEERLGQAPPPAGTPVPPPDPAVTEPEIPTQPTPAPGAATPPDGLDVSRLVEERVAAAVAPFREQLAATSAELATRNEADRVARRDTLLAAARATGRITPADVDKYRAMFDKGPEHAAAVEDLFATLAASSAVPTDPTPGAHTGGTEPTGDGFTDADYLRLFPDEARKGAGV